MPDNDFRAAMRRLHDAYHAAPDADIHPAPPGHGLFQDAQPGTAQFAARHLLGPGQAPEPIIERIDGVESEGLGVVELIDGRTGRSLRMVKHPRPTLEHE